MHGTSLLYSVNDAKAEERHQTQHFEVLGNRVLYHEGWMAFLNSASTSREAKTGSFCGRVVFSHRCTVSMTGNQAPRGKTSPSPARL
ncbi:MAG: hypothetical protein AB8G23_02395 [Myxococcota bacterium]